MGEANKCEASYILGHSEAEIIRLQTQAKILRPITERLLRSAGIRPGMRVLDLGSGAGDVAMLAAELVGPSGWVIGIDRNSQVLSLATERANRAGFKRLSFHEAAVETFVDDAGYDLVIGRYVLIHQTDPVVFLRAAARLARPGGSMAFHELRMRDACRSVPNVPLWEMIDTLLRLAFSSALPHYDAGERLIEHFAHAGLPEPNLFCETHVWGAADLPYYAWAVDTLTRSFTSAAAFRDHSGRVHGDRNAGNAGQGCCAPSSQPSDWCAANMCLDQNVTIRLILPTVSNQELL